MKSFPVFGLLEVRDFGLYPGREGDREGLRIEFHPGLTLVVGANGLGKTTLIKLIYRMISGPFDIPQLPAGADLGFRRLETKPLRRDQRKTFAARVSDGASTASANLELTLGSTPVVVQRRLSDLTLQTAQIGDTVCHDEETFQALVAEAAGLASFGDFILMLRYLVFYFEDRRQLVWDPSAQRQLLRILFLPPDLAQSWAARERSIIENDSSMRNFRAVVGKAEKILAKSVEKKSDALDLRAELEALEQLQEPDRLRLEELEGLTSGLERSRQGARLAHLRAQQEREARFRALENAKLMAIDARFPGHVEVGLYVIAHLLSEDKCLVCGESAPQSARQYTARLVSDHCVVCNSPLTRPGDIVESHEVVDKRVSVAEGTLTMAERALAATTRELEEAQIAFDHHIAEMTRLTSDIAGRSARLEQITDALPPSEAALRKRRLDLASIRSQLETMTSELEEERAAFRQFVEQCSEQLLSSSEAIVDTFSELAGSFLSERVLLTWRSRAERIGQGGEAIPFPVFELNMSGSDFLEPTRRAGPDDVSASQREFIDLSFRMALMRAAGSGATSLVVDAPESSLDAVFARRAGETLNKFGSDGCSTILVTSNLLEGNLLPTLIEGIASTPEKGQRLVDLFEVARPTAALETERPAYDNLRSSVLHSLS